ncbi:hypothetical protein [Halococcus saccharolyticus]|nr:hypothetical protein [Halococcus saccharolyticus]
MDSSRLAGIGFLVAGLVALLWFSVDPAVTVPAIFSAVIGAGLCSLGVLWLRDGTEPDHARDGRRISVPVAVGAAAVLFAIGVAAAVGV